jgi:hypothetical protein
MRLSAGLMTLSCALPFQSAQADSSQPPEPKIPINRNAEAMAPIEDTPGLPRVLLLGDSISVGYTLAVRELLKDRANVHRPPHNCGPTTLGLKKIDEWLGEKPWDLIHFNWGLHDLKYMNAEGERVAPDKGFQQVPIDQYEENLEKLAVRMKATGAKLIWASTTPVPEGSVARIKGGEAAYNAAAQRIIKKHGIPINDLCAFALPRLEKLQRPQNVHFEEYGSEELAKQVAQAILKALGDPE